MKTMHSFVRSLVSASSSLPSSIWLKTIRKTINHSSSTAIKSAAVPLSDLLRSNSLSSVRFRPCFLFECILISSVSASHFVDRNENFVMTKFKMMNNYEFSFIVFSIGNERVHAMASTVASKDKKRMFAFSFDKLTKVSFSEWTANRRADDVIMNNHDYHLLLLFESGEKTMSFWWQFDEFDSALILSFLSAEIVE